MAVVHLNPGPTLPVEHRKRHLALTHVFIDAANDLDSAHIVRMLAEDVTYESQWTQRPIRGRAAVGEFIACKYATMRGAEGAKPSFELGYVDLPTGRDYPVALVTQPGMRQAFIALTASDTGQILRHDILELVPSVESVRPGNPS